MPRAPRAASGRRCSPPWSPLLALRRARRHDGRARRQTPSDVLAAAKKNLDDTTGVQHRADHRRPARRRQRRCSRPTASAPTPRPSTGTIKVVAERRHRRRRVVAVDGKVYAKLPLTPSSPTIDPADYGAPDPAELIDPDGGLSSLLTDGHRTSRRATASAAATTTARC